MATFVKLTTGDIINLEHVTRVTAVDKFGEMRIYTSDGQSIVVRGGGAASQFRRFDWLTVNLSEVADRAAGMTE